MDATLCSLCRFHYRNFTLFLLLLLFLAFTLFGLTCLRNDTGRLVLDPLQRMLKIVLRCEFLGEGDRSGGSFCHCVLTGDFFLIPSSQTRKILSQKRKDRGVQHKATPFLTRSNLETTKQSNLSMQSRRLLPSSERVGELQVLVSFLRILQEHRKGKQLFLTQQYRGEGSMHYLVLLVLTDLVNCFVLLIGT